MSVTVERERFLSWYVQIEGRSVSRYRTRHRAEAEQKRLQEMLEASRNWSWAQDWSDGAASLNQL